MPMLRDDGPPVSHRTIKEAREDLPTGYGHRVVTEDGRRVLLVRSPRPKPEYPAEVAEVALHVSLEDTRDVRDVLLIGHEKSCRLEPVMLRDRIREHAEQGAALVEDVRRHLSRDYGVTTRPTPHAREGTVAVLRLPRRAVSEVTPEDILELRRVLEESPGAADAHVAYLVADRDHERLGADGFRALTGAPEPEAPPTPEAESARADALKAAALASSRPASGARVETASLPRPTFAAEAPKVAVPTRVPESPTPTAPVRPEPAPVADPAPRTPEPSAVAADEMTALHADDEFEVYVRKTPRDGAPAPRAPPEPDVKPESRAPEPEPQPEPGPSGPGYGDGAPPSRVMEVVEENEEFEVFVTKKTESVTLPESPQAASPPAEPVAPAPEPEPEAARAPPATTRVPGPSGDNGTVVEPAVMAAVDAVATLAGKLEGAGYEVVEDVEVMGHTFDAAAHKLEGKRILVKRYDRVDAPRLEEMRSVANDLGADVCILVTEDAADGVRLASWGGRVLVLSPEEAARLNP